MSDVTLMTEDEIRARNEYIMLKYTLIARLKIALLEMGFYEDSTSHHEHMVHNAVENCWRYHYVIFNNDNIRIVNEKERLVAEFPYRSATVYDDVLKCAESLPKPLVM